MQKYWLPVVFSVICLIHSFPSLADQPTPPIIYAAGVYKINAGFVPDKTRIVVGEPLWVTLKIVNAGTVPFKTEAPIYPEEFRCDVTVTDASGLVVARPVPSGPTDEFVEFPTLKTGDSIVERTLATQYCSFDKPGIYTFKCSRSVTVSPDGLGDATVHGQTIIVSDSFSVEVDDHDPVAIGSVIERLANQALTAPQAEAGEAAEGLSLIPDERIVPWLAKIVLQKNDSTEGFAIGGLGQFSTLEAAKALLPALREDHSMQHAFVGYTLKEMENRNGAPKQALMDAVRIPLLAELHAPRPTTRATAAGALGQTGDPAALQPLIQAMADSSQTVRNEAAEAVGILGGPKAEPVLLAGLHSKDEDFHLACAKGLIMLKPQFDPSWLLPLARSLSATNTTDPIAALDLIADFGGSAAGPAIAGCIHFDDPTPSGTYNFWFIHQLESCPDAPRLSSEWQSDDTAMGHVKAVAANRAVLAKIRKWLDSKEPKQ